MSRAVGKTEQSDVITGLQKQVKNLETENKNLNKTVDNLRFLNTEMSEEKGKFQVKAAEKPSKIGYIVLGFFIGFLFSLLLIFTLWFLSLFTKSVSNFYSQIFCSNLAK